MHKGTHISEDDRSAGSVGGASAPVSSLPKPPLGSVILSFQADRRRYLGLEEASIPVDGFEPIGVLAVRLLAEWSLPRMKMLPTLREANAGSAEEPIWEG